MLRNIGAVIAGLIAGNVINMAIVMLNMQLFPGPEGLDMNDPDQMQAYIAELPTVAMLIAMVAHLSQAALGGWVAARLAGSRPRVLAMIIGVLTVVGSIANHAMIGGPTWMLVELPLELALAWGVGTLELRRRG